MCFADIICNINMRLNVDAELQHLISVSIEKLTTGHSDPTCARRGDRKSRSIDLRKALFVAHVLQEVRCAYLEDDYEIVANTVSDTRSSKCNWEAEIREINYDTVKDVNERCIEGVWPVSGLCGLVHPYNAFSEND